MTMISSLKNKVSGVGFQVSGSGFRGSTFRHRASGFRLQASGTENRRQKSEVRGNQDRRAAVCGRHIRNVRRTTHCGYRIGSFAIANLKVQSEVQGSGVRQQRTEARKHMKNWKMNHLSVF